MPNATITTSPAGRFELMNATSGAAMALTAADQLHGVLALLRSKSETPCSPDEFRAYVCMAYVTSGRPLSPDDEHAARALYREIKEGLRSEYRAMDPDREQARLTEAERRWYFHTIHEAYVHLHAPVNARPSTGDWFDSLYWAHGDVSNTIHALREAERS